MVIKRIHVETKNQELQKALGHFTVNTIYSWRIEDYIFTIVAPS